MLLAALMLPSVRVERVLPAMIELANPPVPAITLIVACSEAWVGLTIHSLTASTRPLFSPQLAEIPSRGTAIVCHSTDVQAEDYAIDGRDRVGATGRPLSADAMRDPPCQLPSSFPPFEAKSPNGSTGGRTAGL